MPKPYFSVGNILLIPKEVYFLTVPEKMFHTLNFNAHPNPTSSILDITIPNILDIGNFCTRPNPTFFVSDPSLEAQHAEDENEFFSTSMPEIVKNDCNQV